MPNNRSWFSLRTLGSCGRWSPLLALLVLLTVAAASSPDEDAGDSFKVGERLTYTVGFEKFTNVAYAELYTASRGKIGETEAVELRARVKTLDFLSAAFYLVDESRTIFAAPDSGIPLFIQKTQNLGGLPKETTQNYLSSPTGNYDLVTMIYKIRQSQGSGSFNIFEGERVYPVTFQLTGNERIKTDAGEFETTLHTVQCEYLTEIGIREFRINLSTDDAKVPVAVRFKTAKGEFRARLASIQNIEPPTEPVPTPVPISTPKPTPLPTAPPRLYVDNQPLAEELSFTLGETLEYAISAGDKPVATFILQATERRQVQNEDSLLLSAVVTDAAGAAGIFQKGDGIRTQVSPEMLTPRKLDISFTGSLSSLNQSVTFDERTNLIIFKGTGQVEAPVGTHNILSLIYAVRSFNLKPSKDTSNPINDTRVAVFWDNRPYIFTLRPSPAELISMRGEKVSAQLVSISTQNPQLDTLNIKIWLSNDARRVPLRFSIGGYQADLISDKIVVPK
jgi:hypothetical protein